MSNLKALLAKCPALFKCLSGLLANFAANLAKPAILSLNFLFVSRLYLSELCDRSRPHRLDLLLGLPVSRLVRQLRCDRRLFLTGCVVLLLRLAPCSVNC